MFDNMIYRYPIVDILKALGVRASRTPDMYYSPFRDERTPSFHVNRQANVWYDHGAGIGGTNVQLVMLARHCSEREAQDYIRSLHRRLPAVSAPPPAPSAGRQTIVAVRDLFTPYIVRYIEGRGIPLEYAMRYCREALVQNDAKGRRFNLIAFPNNSGGYAFKSPSGYKSTDRAGVSTINTSGELSLDASSPGVALFEGFFDFLSWLVMRGSLLPPCDVAVLNSTANRSRVIRYLAKHGSVEAWLDNDKAGRECLRMIIQELPDLEITDMSSTYREFNDVNDYLRSRRKDDGD